jgi:hypothetical protein
MSNGILLSFSSEAALRNAVEHFRAQQIGPLETYSPMPVTGPVGREPCPWSRS